ncbi:MAG TPA: hypothetical protein PKO23_17980, partial [Candidatus Hydrogenedentes bacterium]|nr:hypothetical protein [Candidatus Hydrogenedentota bacterium]
MNIQQEIKTNMRRSGLFLFAAILAGLCCVTPFARAEEAASALADTRVMLDTLWVMLAGFLVFFMNAGFALVETGFCRAKNAVNILSKNFIVFAIASLSFWATGFALMFGDGNALLGWSGFFLSGA